MNINEQKKLGQASLSNSISRLSKIAVKPSISTDPFGNLPSAPVLSVYRDLDSSEKKPKLAFSYKSNYSVFDTTKTTIYNSNAVHSGVLSTGNALFTRSAPPKKNGLNYNKENMVRVGGGNLVNTIETNGYPYGEPPTNNSSKTVSNNGLIAYWAFERQLEDSTSNSNNLNSFGNYGGYYGLENYLGIKGNYIEYGLVKANNFPNLGRTFSISAWVRDADNAYYSGGTSKIIIASTKPNNNDNSSSSFELSTVGDSVEFKSNGIKAVTGPVLTYGEVLFDEYNYGWNHIVLVKTNQRVKIYVNGQIQADSIDNGNYISSTLYVGTNGASSLDGWSDLDSSSFQALDEIGIWDRALSELEIKNLSNLTPIDDISVGRTEVVSITGQNLPSLIGVSELSGRNINLSIYPSYLKTAGTPIELTSGHEVCLYGEYFTLSGDYGYRLSTPPALNSGIIAYWKLDDDGSGNLSLADATQNGYNFVNNNEVALTSGKISGSANFSGTSYLSNSGFLIPNSEFTMSLWVKGSSFPDGSVILGQWNYNNNSPYMLAIGCNYGKINVFWSTNGSSLTNRWQTDITLNSIANNNWHNIVLAYSNYSASIYLNSVLVGSPESLAPARSSSGISLGMGNNGYFNGQVDEVAIWNRELSSMEVGNIYYLSSGNTYPFDSKPVLDNPTYILNNVSGRSLIPKNITGINNNQNISGLNNFKSIYKKLGKNIEVSALEVNGLLRNNPSFGSGVYSNINRNVIKLMASEDGDAIPSILFQDESGFNFSALSEVGANALYSTRTSVTDTQYGEYQSFKLPNSVMLNEGYNTGINIINTINPDTEEIESSVIYMNTGHIINYDALDFDSYIYPNNFYGSSSTSVDGLLCITLGEDENKKIVFISNHALITGSGNGSRYSGVSSRNVTSSIPSGMINSVSSGFIVTGFNDYLKQSGNLINTDFYKLYGNMYGEVDTDNIWSGLIPSGTPYSVSVLSAAKYNADNINLSVYNTGIRYVFGSGYVNSGELSYIVNNLFMNVYAQNGQSESFSEDFSRSSAVLDALKNIEKQKYSLQKESRPALVDKGFSPID